MRASFTEWFLAEPRLRSTGYRYGFLIFVLALLTVMAVLCLYLSPSYPGGRYFPLIAPLGLVINHLAFQFRWSKAVTFFLRTAVLFWIFFGLPYIFFIFIVFTRS